MLLPLLLLGVLIAFVVGAHALRRKGAITDEKYSTLVSVISILVTAAALALLYLRLRR